jgi:hypothetical protein
MLRAEDRDPTGGGTVKADDDTNDDVRARRRTLTGVWHFPGAGGYEAIATRVA